MNNLSSQSRERPVRIGLIGVTGYAQAYHEGLNKLVESGQAAWGAVTIVDRKQAAETVAFFEAKGVPIFSDYQEMLEETGPDLDWVCIPTGIGWHRTMAVDCLRRNLPILVEKPLAPTLQDVALIQEAERAAGVPVGVGFQHMYLDETWEVKNRLLGGEIGELIRIDSLGLWPRSESYYERNHWSGQLHDGRFWILDSPLHNALSHVLNLILFWSGKTLETGGELRSVAAELYRAKPIASYDTVRTEAVMKDGVEIAITLSHSGLHKLDPEIRITGTKGTFIWRFCGHHTFEVEGNISSILSPGHVAMRERMLASMLECVRRGTVPMCTTELAKGAVRWVNAVHDCVPIHEVPARYRRRLQDDTGETFDTIQDLEYFLLRSHHERRSFADTGVPWAVRAGGRDLDDYDAFEGRYVAAPISAIP